MSRDAPLLHLRAWSRSRKYQQRPISHATRRSIQYYGSLPGPMVQLLRTQRFSWDRCRNAASNSTHHDEHRVSAHLVSIIIQQ